LCDKDMGGSDCSVNITIPPTMIGIPDMGKCDLSARECARTAVIGKTFVGGHGLKCRLKKFKVCCISSFI